jgi:hypothetical protein
MRLRQAVIGRPELNRVERAVVAAGRDSLHVADVGLRLTALTAASAGLVGASAALVGRDIVGPPEVTSGLSATDFRLLLPLAFAGLVAHAQLRGIELLGPGPLSRYGEVNRQLTECPEGAARLLVGLARHGEPTARVGVVRGLLADASAIADLDTVAGADHQGWRIPREPRLELALGRMAAHPAMQPLRAAQLPFQTALRTAVEVEQLRQTFVELDMTLDDAHLNADGPHVHPEAAEERRAARQLWGVGDQPMTVDRRTRLADRLQSLANSIYLHEEVGPLVRGFLTRTTRMSTTDALQLLTCPDIPPLLAQPAVEDVIAFLLAQESAAQVRQHGAA